MQDELSELKNIITDLVYISETDSAWEAFDLGGSKSVSEKKVKAAADRANSKAVTTEDAEKFFAHLTEIKDHFGAAERKAAKKYTELYAYLSKNLSGLKIIKVGDIRKDIFAVGIDQRGHLTGVKTYAVET